MHDKRTSRKRAGILLLSCRLKIEKLVTFRVLENDFLRLFIGALLHVIALSTHAVGSMEKKGKTRRKKTEKSISPPPPPRRKGGSLSRREKRRYFHVTIQLRKCNLHVRRLHVLTLCNYCLVRAIEIHDRDPYGSDAFKTFQSSSRYHINSFCNDLKAELLETTRYVCVCVCVYLRVYALLYYILYNIRGKLHQNMSIVNRHPLFLSD